MLHNPIGNIYQVCQVRQIKDFSKAIKIMPFEDFLSGYVM